MVILVKVLVVVSVLAGAGIAWYRRVCKWKPINPRFPGAFGPAMWAKWMNETHAVHGRVLYGWYAHWCPHLGLRPIDETCDEWPCQCRREQFKFWWGKRGETR